MSNFIDLTGQKIGHWTVIDRATSDKWGNTQWLCRCICGNERILTASNLRSGKTHSCGCEVNKDKWTYLGLPIEERILTEVKEIKEKMKGLSIQNNKERLIYEMLGSQLMILEKVLGKELF